LIDGGMSTMPSGRTNPWTTKCRRSSIGRALVPYQANCPNPSMRKEDNRAQGSCQLKAQPYALASGGWRLFRKPSRGELRRYPEPTRPRMVGSVSSSDSQPNRIHTTCEMR
jgi:hypothetical protein